MAKYYMVYLPKATEEGEKNEAFLKAQFGENNVYTLNGSGAFVVKTAEDVHFQQVLDKVGLNESEGQRGVVIDFSPYKINGWYSSTLWSFIGDKAGADASES